jgi:sulfur relay (sulfurtransferase) complex TusBCD TusD component (DsrE family)
LIPHDLSFPIKKEFDEMLEIQKVTAENNLPVKIGPPCIRGRGLFQETFTKLLIWAVHIY